MAASAAQLYINPKFTAPPPPPSHIQQIHRHHQFSAANDDDGGILVQPLPPSNGGYSTRDQDSHANYIAMHQQQQPNAVNLSSRNVRPASDLTGLRLSPMLHSPPFTNTNITPVEIGYSTFPRMHAKQQQQSKKSSDEQDITFRATNAAGYYAVANNMQPSRAYSYQQPQNAPYPTAAQPVAAQPSTFIYPRSIDELRGEMVDTTLTKRDTGLGVTIIGGEENDEPLQIKSIVPGSAADADGALQPGDLLVFISGTNVLNFTHDAVIDIFKSIQIGQKVRIIACRGYPLFVDGDEEGGVPTEYVKEFAGVEAGGGDTSRQKIDEKKQVLLGNGGLHANSLPVENSNKEERTVVIRKGSIGFGFTIEHSNSTGYQKVKKIGDKKRCAELREGDLLLQINGQRLNTYSHADIVNVLKRYPQHQDAAFHILRPLTKQQQAAAAAEIAARRGQSSTSPSSSRRTRSKSASNSAVATPERASAAIETENNEGNKHSFLGNLLFGKNRRSQRSKTDEQRAASPIQATEVAGKSISSIPAHVRSTSSGGPNAAAENFKRNNQNNNNNVHRSSFARIVTPCFAVPAANSHYAATTSPMTENAPTGGFITQQHAQQQESVVTSTTLIMPPPPTLTNGRKTAENGGNSAVSYPQQSHAAAQGPTYAQVAPRTPAAAHLPRFINAQQQQQQPLTSILVKHQHQSGVSHGYADESAQPTDPRRYAQPPFNSANMPHAQLNDDEGDHMADDAVDNHGNEDDDDDDVDFDDAVTAAAVAEAAAAGAAAVEQLQILLKRDDNGFGFRVVGGNEEGTQVSVGYIVPYGAAQQDGRLQTGDEILSVDGDSTIGASHQQTVSIIRRAAENGFILLAILRRRGGIDAASSALISSASPHRNKMSSMPDIAATATAPSQQAPKIVMQKQPPPMQIIEISLVRGTDEGFGFVLVSSMANNSNNASNTLSSLGGASDFDDDEADGDQSYGPNRAPSARYLNACPVIGRILPNSPAYRCEALRVGDRLLRVNGIDIYNYQHKDIVNIIKNSGNAVTLTIASASSSPSPGVSNTDNMLRSPANGSRQYAVQPHHSQTSSISNLSLNQQQRQKQLQQAAESSSPPSVQSTASTTASVSTQSRSLISQDSSTSSITSLQTPIEQQQHLSTPVLLRQHPHNTAAVHQLPRSNTVPIHSDSTAAKQHQAFAERGIDLPQPSAMPSTSSKSVYNVAYLSVQLPKGPRGFGFSIRGGKEFESMPLFILKIAAEGPASESNMLRVGDEIVEINGINTRNLTHAEAIGLIKDGGNQVNLLLKRPRRVGSLIGGREDDKSSKQV